MSFTRGLPVLRWLDRDWIPAETEISWFYSDTVVQTDIPNQVTVKAQTVTEPETGRVLRAIINADASTSDFRFTNLDDEVLNYGWQFNVPIMAKPLVLRGQRRLRACPEGAYLPAVPVPTRSLRRRRPVDP